MNIRLINDDFYKPDFMEFLMRLPCLYLMFYLPFANSRAALRERLRCSSRTTALPFANGK